jgi:hypothetical protein
VRAKMTGRKKELRNSLASKLTRLQNDIERLSRLQDWAGNIHDIDIPENTTIYIWGTHNIDVYPHKEGLADQLALQLAVNEGCSFRRSINQTDGDITLEANLDNGVTLKIESKPATTCRITRVFVGTKTVEEYRYDVECDEGEKHDDE